MGFLKGLLSSIPYIRPLVVAWDGYWHARQQDTISKLSEAVEKIEEEKIDIEYLNSEEFMDLFCKALRIRSQTRLENKAKFILGLLIESMQKDRALRFSTSLKESFLSILDQLTDEEMNFLYEFSKGTYSQKTKDDIYGMGDQYAIAIDGLLARGILREKNQWDRYICESMLGREFIDYLKILASKVT